MFQLGNHQKQFLIDTRTEDVVPLLKKLIERNTLLIGHNIKYDYSVIKTNYGLEIENVFDTMLACQLLAYNQKESSLIKKKKLSFSLEACVQRYYDKYAYSPQGALFYPAVTKKIRESFAKITDGAFSEAQQWYALFDVFTCYALFLKTAPKLEEHDLKDAIYQENEFLKVAADCEINGVPLDTDLWLDASAEAKVKLEELGKSLAAIADINWASPKQVNEVFKSLGVDTSILDKKTGEIKESVGRVHLEKQIARFPQLQPYIEYGKARKTVSSYGEKFLRHLNPTDGRIHTSLLQLKDTGRTGSTDPNMQNIPHGDAYRRAFVAPQGHTFVVADFSNQEMRLLAHYSGDKNLNEAFATGVDIHTATARIMYNNPDLGKESEERRYAKSVNFLIGYGGGAKKLSENFGIPMVQAKKVFQTYNTQFSGLQPYFIKGGQEAREVGYVLINDVSKRRGPIESYETYKWLEAQINRYKRNGWDVHPKYSDLYSYLDSKLQRTSQNYRIN